MQLEQPEVMEEQAILGHQEARAHLVAQDHEAPPARRALLVKPRSDLVITKCSLKLLL